MVVKRPEAWSNVEGKKGSGAIMNAFSCTFKFRCRLLICAAFLLTPGLSVAQSSNDVSEDVSDVVAQNKRRQRRIQKRRRARRKARRAGQPAMTRRRGPVEIPIDFGIGPAVHMLTGPVQDEQRYHTGLKLSLAAVIDRALIQSQKHRIPAKYRKLAGRVNEVRFRPGPVMLIPDTVYLSPAREGTSMYGANWRLLGVGLPLLRMPRLSLGTGLNLSYLYLGGSEAIPETHFFRPGLDLSASVELPLSKSFLVSFGWTSFFYPPQELGGDFLAWGDREKSIWHIGQAFMKLHFRFPYTVNL